MVEFENSPGELAWRIIEPVWNTISIYDGHQIFCEQFAKVQPEVGHLFAVWWCHSEVCNGGFHQFFGNPTGVLAPEAAAGFHAVGLIDCEELVKEAMRFFGQTFPRDHEQRYQQLPRGPGKPRAEWDPFCNLDKRFYQLLDWKLRIFERAIDDYARRISALFKFQPNRLMSDEFDIRSFGSSLD